MLVQVPSRTDGTQAVLGDEPFLTTDRILDTIEHPQDLRDLGSEQLEQLAGEIREVLISTVAATGGHLAPNLGVVELTIGLHRALVYQ